MCSLPVRWLFRPSSGHTRLSSWSRMYGTRLPPHLHHYKRSDQRRLTPANQAVLDPQAIDAVAIYFSRLGAPMYTHEKVTLAMVAESIARINGYRCTGVCDPAVRSAGRLFFVPDDTLMLDEARALGIHSPRQLYGAVTPYPFTKTKAITHRLVSARAERPSGWSSAFAESVRIAVLPGYTAFSPNDARTAGRRLLLLGPIRVKEPLGDGGQ